MKKRYGLSVALGVCVFLLNGCSMVRLNKELKEMDQYKTIAGTIVCDSPMESPVVVALWGIGKDDLSGYWLTRCDAGFSFLRESGRYYLMAFGDTNEDGRYQSTEFAGSYNQGHALDMASGDQFDAVEIKLLPPGQVQIPPEVTQSTRSGIDQKFSLRMEQVGELTTIDNPLFSDESGALGLWTPLQFIDEIGMKVYFLEAYDPHKIPVLFVHGAGGHPGTWKTIIEQMNHDKYQPWLAFYPSGLRLDQLGAIYAKVLDELQEKYGFEQVDIVAHSMGGLVSRSMILHYGALQQRAEIPLFITLSTPFGGHAGAAAGVKHAPAVIPSWYDMVPDSPFLQDLYAKPMPPELKHYLFFSFQGTGKFQIGHENNDGAVTIKSQLVMPIQRLTERATGIDATHVGILSDSNAVEMVRQLFSEQGKPQ